ncbi:MAG TPA: hypothetical protein VF444_05205 [Pseudonocardiaceae bacterium]
MHHAVEQQVLNRYPGLVRPEELHSFENLRGIPTGAINNRVHLKLIRAEWKKFYQSHQHPSKQDLLDFATHIDDKYGRTFKPQVR